MQTSAGSRVHGVKVPKLKSVLALCRVSNLPTVWMNVVAAAVLSGADLNIYIALLALSLSAFYCGGMAFNDLCDLEYDRARQPYRPLAAGRISVAQAWFITVALFAIAFLGLVLAPFSSGLIAGVGLLLVIVLYDRYHKRHAATVFLMAAARLFVYVVTALALTDQINAAVWIAAGLQTAYVLLLTVVARYESRTSGGHYQWPVIPWMIVAMPLIDGIVLAWNKTALWLVAALAAVMLTRLGQRYVRGD